ncbi:MAG TPA: RNA polymerase sigma factor [Myxococcota bacterium]
MPLHLLKAEPPPMTTTSSSTPARELDVEQLRAAGAGNAVACRAFVGCYERRVFTLCLRLLGDRGAAEDAAQETFLKALRALSRFEAGQQARPSTWLLTIATNHCLDELRKRRRRPALVGGVVLDRALAVVADERLASLGVDERLGEQEVMRALSTLTDDQRATFVLRVFAERSVEEAAAALAVDEGTIKSRLSRARTALRTVLGDRR